MKIYEVNGKEYYCIRAWDADINPVEPASLTDDEMYEAIEGIIEDELRDLEDTEVYVDG